MIAAVVVYLLISTDWHGKPRPPIEYPTLDACVNVLDDLRKYGEENAYCKEEEVESEN